MGQEGVVKRQAGVAPRRAIGQPHLEGGGGAMPAFLESADGGDERAGGLTAPALLPFAPATELEIGRLALGGMKAPISQPAALPLHRRHQGQQGWLGGLGGLPGPSHDLALPIQDPAACQAATPAPVRFALRAELVGAAALADRMAQLNPIGSNNGKQRGLREKVLTPALGGEQ